MSVTENFLLILCLTLRTTSSDEKIRTPSESLSGLRLENRTNIFGEIVTHQDGPINVQDGRSLGDETDFIDTNENDEGTKYRRTKPIRNIFMGIYKNYKSTYLGNRTSLQYKKSLHGQPEKLMASPEVRTTTKEVETSTETLITSKKTKKKKRKTKKTNRESEADPLLYSYDGEYRYNIGMGVNVSLDTRNDVVSVNLDEACLKDILLGWDDSGDDEGRGKKHEMISKILPLFILPFLIQSAIIPFLVTKLKLLLIKSILVGKLAVFLLIISAIKNSNKPMTTYETAPSYWAGEPSRRSEVYNGYRVEGRPTTWVN